jgi:hypothetical protein
MIVGEEFSSTHGQSNLIHKYAGPHKIAPQRYVRAKCGCSFTIKRLGPPNGKKCKLCFPEPPIDKVALFSDEFIEEEVKRQGFRLTEGPYAIGANNYRKGLKLMRDLILKLDNNPTEAVK